MLDKLDCVICPLQIHRQGLLLQDGPVNEVPQGKQVVDG